MRIKNNLHHGLVLILGMLVSGCVAVTIGKELNWDLASYHLYNPFAYLHQRAGLDVWPMEFIHTHLSPTADFLTYYFVTTWQPKMAVFFLGALHGMNVWLLYAIGLLLFSEMPRVTNKRSLACLLAVLGMYGPMVVSGLGSFQHDALVSLFILGFILLFQQAWNRDFSKKYIFIASILLGVGAGLKLTAGIFVLGALISVLFLPLSVRERIRIQCVISAGVCAGLLLTSGYWFALQWRDYHNPIFPFLNGFFHSPYFPFYNWRDPRFLPQSWLETLFFPFYFSFDGRTNDLPFRDFRFVVLYVLLMAALIKRVSISSRVRWLLVFFISAYIVWQCGFSIMRYAMPLEMLAPLLVFCLLDKLSLAIIVRNGWMCVFTALMVMGMYPAQSVRAPIYEGTYFNVQVPAMVQQHPHAMVLMPISAYALDLKPRPQTYLIAYLPETWRYVGIPFRHERFTLSARMRDAIQSFSGQIYILSSSEYIPLVTRAASQLHLTAAGACVDITSDRQKISDEDVKLCPFKK